MLRASVLLALLASPAMAQDLAFRVDATQSCLWTVAEGPGLRACIGRAAQACMEQPGGSSTIGMEYCLGQELRFWDDMLNEAYGKLMPVMRSSDARLPSDLANQASSLRDMQRAWITYRDARCAHEAALWQGGTGARTAYAYCQMDQTGEQALYLSALYSGEG